MNYDSLDDYVARGPIKRAKGPLALILVEDLVEVDTTIRHHRAAGFSEIVVLAPPELRLPADIAEKVSRVSYRMGEPQATTRAVNTVIAAAPEGTWLFYCYNAEYLFHPFCETRNVRELLTFHADERRSAMLTYVIDLYAADLSRAPDAVSLTDAHLDRTGYYALSRPDPAHPDRKMERQLDFFGGVRWRFEEHVPKQRRRIDRISLFRTRRGLELREDHTLNDEEMNTYACPWHNNLTAALCSFRAAKALRTNAGSRYDIPTFKWQNSVPFSWHSQQLMDLGLMEPGQWF